MMTIECQGRDGSPQSSHNSGATRRPPWRLRLKNGASRRSAPTFSTLRASAPPREVSSLPTPPSTLRSHLAFTLLEVLVATAVLAMMMVFLFNLLGSSAKIWEIGNKKIEAAQAARVGLSIMAKDLQNAIAWNLPSYTTSGTPIENIVPFKAIDLPNSTLGLGGSSVNAAGSQQVCGVLLSGNLTIPYNEFGFMCAYIDDAEGINPMIGKRYYLVKKVDQISSSGGNFFFRGAPSPTWFNDSTEFYPLIDNCIRLNFQYYGDQNSATGTPVFNSNGAWLPEDRLPLGVLVTLTVLDSKTASKIAAISSGALSDNDITAGINAANGIGSPSNDIQRFISQGSVTISRFIPFNQK